MGWKNKGWYSKNSEHCNGCITCALSFDSSHVCYNKDTIVFMHLLLSWIKMELKDYILVFVLILALLFLEHEW